MNNGYYPFPLNPAPFPQGLGYWRGGPLAEGVAEIVRHCSGLELKPGQIGSGAQGDELRETRSSEVAFVPINKHSEWMYEEAAKVIRELNMTQYGYDLSGFLEMQYTVYRPRKDGKNDHYDFHVDALGKGAESARKLSAVLQLSDPFEYEGGDLMIWNEHQVVVPKEKGLLYTFPSYMLHKVTPVTRGVRKSLVIWAVGPQFR